MSVLYRSLILVTLLGILPVLAPRPVASADGVEVQTVVVSAELQSIAEDGSSATFEVKRKEIVVDLRKAKLQSHRAVPLQDLQSGTPLTTFSKIQDNAGRYPNEYIQLIVLTTGPFETPPVRHGKPHLPSWHRGALSFNDNKSIAYLGGIRMNVNAKRPVCVVEDAKISEFWEVDDDGKKEPKKAWLRGRLTEIEIDGKKTQKLVVDTVTLPTKGFPAREYRYLLDPERMIRDHTK